MNKLGRGFTSTFLTPGVGPKCFGSPRMYSHSNVVGMVPALHIFGNILKCFTYSHEIWQSNLSRGAEKFQNRLTTPPTQRGGKPGCTFCSFPVNSCWNHLLHSWQIWLGVGTPLDNCVVIAEPLSGGGGKCTPSSVVRVENVFCNFIYGTLGEGFLVSFVNTSTVLTVVTGCLLEVNFCCSYFLAHLWT